MSTKIEEMWAWVSVDPDTGDEGIVAANMPGLGWHPLVTGRKHLTEKMELLAQRVAKESGRKIRLVRFTSRTEVKELTP